ncbi:uncharacterized protein [Parasteatoda tepidariorum]|uniref:uncharacterized protein n=1 Tax=Parasteatoda tepidariorum TaxID=114398 RepID=UPI0039BD6691
MSDRTDRDREYRRQRRLDPTFRQNEQERRRINRQNNRELTNARQRENRSRAANRLREIDGNQYLGESYSDDCPPLLIGSMSVECSHCRALSFVTEHGRIKRNCCHNGKIKLNPTHPYPETLKQLLLGNDNDSMNFRQNIRFHNSSFAMTAFCTTQEIQFKGISCVALRGEVNAMATTSIMPANNEKPRFAQIYIHENETALACRTSERCKPSVLKIIQDVMQLNPYAQVYKSLFEAYKRHPTESVRLEFHKLTTTDGRRYNLPTSGAAAEVSAVVVTGAEGLIPDHVQFIAYPKHQFVCQKMYKLSHHVEPMVFPLLFPSGDPGYSLNVPNNAGSSRVTAVQYFGWRLRVLRDFNIFTSAGRLSQQYILHGYITMEWNRLNYIKSHQNLFRRETLQGLIDHVQYSSANTSDIVRLGRAVILPSSFVGSPRAMQQHFQDCMALSRDVGRPDLFVTFTANPQWPEIREYLSQLPTGFTASDIPHVVVRAFYCRFEEFVKEIAAGKVFGKVMGYTFNIEFQKRGLPHAHCLFILNPRDKLLTPSSIDRFICAEIPPKDNFPNLHQKVSKHMLHGPHKQLHVMTKQVASEIIHNLEEDMEFCNLISATQEILDLRKIDLNKDDFDLAHLPSDRQEKLLQLLQDMLLFPNPLRL